jgi:putative SOS response-associated peptidase YedK
MCGRYELHSHPAAIALAFGLAAPPAVHARYNIAPMTEVGLVRVNAEGERELVRMRWGFVPRWAKDPSIGVRMINARGETIADKPSFRMSYRKHRCLLPADGFYEWRAAPPRSDTGDASRKQPIHIGMADGSLFGLAGLYERWRSEDGNVLDTCTIVTTAANELIAPIHDRMPLILAREDYARWLDPGSPDVGDLIVPYPPAEMAYYPVSPRVNNVRNDDASVLDRVESTVGDRGAEHEPPPPPPEPEQESLF